MAVSAAVSAIVTVVIGTLLNWGERVVTGVRRRLAADHAPLNLGGGWSSSRVGSTGPTVRMLVSCAPDRSLRQTFVNPDRAVRVVREHWGDLFPPEPVFSIPGSGVRFDAAAGSPMNDYAWVHSSGRIELCVHVPSDVTDGVVTIAVLDLLQPIMRVLSAARSREYQAAFPLPRPPRFQRRFDWGIGVSPTVCLPDLTNVSWKRLDFPGRVPPRAGTDQQAFQPVAGYGARQLTSWDVRQPTARLLRAFLEDFLYENGFHDIDEAVSDVLAGVQEPVGVRWK